MKSNWKKVKRGSGFMIPLEETGKVIEGSVDGVTIHHAEQDWLQVVNNGGECSYMLGQAIKLENEGWERMKLEIDGKKIQVRKNQISKFWEESGKSCFKVNH